MPLSDHVLTKIGVVFSHHDFLKGVFYSYSLFFFAGNVLFNFWRVHSWKSLWQELENCPVNLATNSLKVPKPKMGIWFPNQHLADRECCTKNCLKHWYNAKKVLKQWKIMIPAYNWIWNQHLSLKWSLGEIQTFPFICL